MIEGTGASRLPAEGHEACDDGRGVLENWLTPSWDVQRPSVSKCALGVVTAPTGELDQLIEDP